MGIYIKICELSIFISFSYLLFHFYWFLFVEHLTATLNREKTESAGTKVHCLSDSEMRRFIELETSNKVRQEEAVILRRKTDELNQQLRGTRGYYLYFYKNYHERLSLPHIAITHT